MTKDIAYVVRIEENGQSEWLCYDYDSEKTYVSSDFSYASYFENENDVKDALRQYYGERHEMKEDDRAFVCKVSVSDCACFVKKDIDILLGGK